MIADLKRTVGWELAENMLDGVMLTAPDGRIFAANPAACKLLGRSEAEIVAAGRAGLVVPDQALEQALVERERSGAVTREMRMVRGDGETVLLEVSSRVFAGPGGERLTAMTLRDLEPHRRAEAERAESAARAAELERVRSLSVLAGGIAHEFNNTLQVALAGIELARGEAAGGAPVEQLLAAVEASLADAARLSKAMLAYTGHQNVVRQAADLAALVGAAAARHPHVEVDVVEPDPPTVLADAEALGGAVSVLLANALDATASGGAVRVRVGVADVGAEEAAGATPLGEVAAGRYAFVEVADDGEGMDGPTRARMFDPFFSTRFPGRGLALAAALGVARAHGGGFLVHSEPEQGTTVRLLLPLS